MDELDALRRMRTALGEQEHPDRLAERVGWQPDGADRRTNRVARSARGSRRVFRVPMMTLTAAATVAAVTAGTVGVSLLRDGESPSDPPSGPLSATGGKNWHTVRISGEIASVGRTERTHYKIETRQRYDAWTDPAGRVTLINYDLHSRPWTAKDKSKWKKAGSPKTVTYPADGLQATGFMNPAPAPGPSSANRFPRDNEPGHLGLTTDQIAALPTRPPELTEKLLDIEGNWRVVSKSAKKERIRDLTGQERTRALSEAATELMVLAPAPTKLRNAAFELLRRLPGARHDGGAKDPLGRSGMLISLPLESTTELGIHSAPMQLGTYRRQWIFNVNTALLLATQDRVETPPHGSKPAGHSDVDGKARTLEVKDTPDRFHKPGELLAYEAYQVAEWTDDGAP